MPVALVLLASLLFGTTGTASALGLDGADPAAVGAARIAVGGLSLGAVAAALAVRRRPARAGRERSPDAALVLLVLLVLCGAAGVVGYQASFFAGVEANGVAVGTLVALGSAPVCTGLLSWALRRRFPGRRWSVATAGAVVGVALLSGVGASVGPDGVRPAGLLASLAAGVSYAAYTLATKGLLDRGWNPLTAIGTVFGVAGAVGVVQLASLGDASSRLLDGLPAVLWLGLGTTTLAYILFVVGLARLPAATVATLTLAEPVVATLLGVVVLDERLTAVAVLGILVLVAALALLAAPSSRSPRRPLPREGAARAPA